ncbi:MAG TPA: GGDEF domain-containing protein [Longimicrobium sp.]|jgi:diguanylate cyclase (GGDEF)-like protein/PAS domain S-box-containing protein|uniref:putative bifunctional diguanylate cyclase/phosphodiesterase n=1 Tax=Longimicrobium sp. TaxID=2029185 RepID=UPI002ED93CD6
MPQRFQSLFHHTQDAVCMADAEGRIVQANPAAVARFGPGEDGGPPRHLRDLLTDADEWDGMRAEVEGGEVARRTVRLRGADGEPEHAQMTCVGMHGTEGALQIQAIVHAPAHNPAAEAMDALFDAETGVPNRTAFLDHVARALAESAERPEHRFAVIHLDLNRFQRINETLGHQRGDELLALAAQRLGACVRPGDVVSRAAGDDFLVLLNAIRSEDEALNVARRMGRALAGGYHLGGHEVFCDADVGVVLGGAGYADAEQVLRSAEGAMARGRQTGEVQLFTDEMHARSVAALRLHGDLHHALARGELRVFYQPIVGLDDQRVRAFEALVRWMHPERGLVSPVEFIPVAEDTGLIVPIGEWVLERAAEQLRDWHARFPADPPLAMGINLSLRQFAQPGLVEHVQAVLRRTGVGPDTLKLEVTESIVMGNADTAIDALHALKALGVQLQVDDFGTGYSALSYLHRIPLDVLKIDRSFIVAMAGGEKHLAIVRAIIALAAALGLETTAEGVDDPAQADALRWMGCTYGQGYLWGKPMEAADAERMLAPAAAES